MFFLKHFLPVLLVPGLIAALSLVIVTWLSRGSGYGAAVALAAGYLWGHTSVADWPNFPPLESMEWLGWMAVAAAVMGGADSTLRMPFAVRVAMGFSIFAVLLGLLLGPKFQYGWSPAKGGLLLIAFALVTLLLCRCLSGIARLERGPTALTLVLMLVAGGTSAALMFSGSMLLSQLAAACSASFGGMFLIASLWPGWRARTRSLAPGAALLLSGLWASGSFYAELPVTSVLFLAAAPIVAYLPFRGSTQSVKAVLTQAGLTLVVLLVAVLAAFHASPPLLY